MYLIVCWSPQRSWWACLVKGSVSLWLEIYYIVLGRGKEKNIKRSSWFKVQVLISRMGNVQAARRVPGLSAVLRQGILVRVIQRHWAHRREETGGKARDSERRSFRERNTNDPHSLFNLYLSQGSTSQMLLYWSFWTYSMRIAKTDRWTSHSSKSVSS